MIWPKDTTEAKMEFYGDFNHKGWQEENLARFKPPFMMYYEKKQMNRGFLVHRKLVKSLEIIFGGIWFACNHDQAKVDAAGASDFGGCFNIRRIAGSNNWSNHSWACAIDLSPGTNGFNMTPTISNIVVEEFKKQNFRWGGDYKGRKDPMHFEAVSPA